MTLRRDGGALLLAVLLVGAIWLLGWHILAGFAVGLATFAWAVAIALIEERGKDPRG